MYIRSAYLKIKIDSNFCRVTRILSYYRSPNYPFSIELCGAVSRPDVVIPPSRLSLRLQILRQGSFIDKMVGMGWTEPHTFDDDPLTLIRCISRYNAWLDVMSQLTDKMLVPTLVSTIVYTHFEIVLLMQRSVGHCKFNLASNGASNS